MYKYMCGTRARVLPIPASLKLIKWQRKQQQTSHELQLILFTSFNAGVECGSETATRFHLAIVCSGVCRESVHQQRKGFMFHVFHAIYTECVQFKFRRSACDRDTYDAAVR